MPISFSQIPANWRMPLYWVEVDASKAGLPINRLPTLLVGVKRTASPGVVNVPVPVASQAQADALFGRGSQLAGMFKAYFANNWAGEVWALPVAEGSTAASGTITFSGTATASGTIHLYIGGRHVAVPVASGDAFGAVATAAKAAIDADLDSYVTCGTPAGGAITLTAREKGTYGNDIRLTDSYYGAVGGEIVPAGITIVHVQPTSGAGDPTFTTAISNLGENQVEYVCLPFTDSTSLTAWETEFGFSDTGRWGFIRQLYGHLFSANRDTYANQLTFGAGRNSPQLSVLGVEVTSPSPRWEWAAAYTAKAARALSIDPARPLQSLHLEGIMPAPLQSRYLISELNTMSMSGIATQRTFIDGVPTLARETTTYKTNLYGVSDDAYELVTTPATLARLLRNQRQAITSKYPRHKLANDGTRFGAGQAIVTPKIIKAELVAQYRIDEFNGLVEDGDNFKDNLIVERDPNVVDRVNVLYPPDLINGLRVFAVLAQFRLQYNRGVDVAMI
jgi:phage tail sheath gpL-like